MSERIKQLDSPHNACQFRADCRKAEAEIDELTDVLIRQGFARCDIPACNCGSWHHKYGLPERFAEIKEVLRDADVLNNDTGNMLLNAIKKLIAQRDELQERLDNRNKLGTPSEHVLQSNAMLRAELAALKNHLDASESEPVAWIRYCDGSYEGPIMHNLMEDVRKKSGAWTPLFERDAEIARLREDAAEQVAKERGET